MPPFFAARFLVAGKLYVPDGPLADYTKGDCQLRHQLRFGAIYLAEGNHSEGLARYPHPIRCVRGADTMLVYMRPCNSCGDDLYDSIPFRPGRYELVELRWDTVLTVPRRLKMHSFARYYAQHAAELKQANPFAGCQFTRRNLDPGPGRNDETYVPADIYRLLLARKRYLSIRPWKLRPITGAEQRALDRASLSH